MKTENFAKKRQKKEERRAGIKQVIDNLLCMKRTQKKRGFLRRGAQRAIDDKSNTLFSRVKYLLHLFHLPVT